MMEGEDQEEDSKEPSQDEHNYRRRNCQRYLLFSVVLILLGGAGAITWYFFDHKPHFWESTSVHFYSGSLSILNRQYSLDHGRMESRAFWTETAKMQKMLKDLIHATELAPYYNSTTVYAFGEGSLTCFFWFALQVPKSQHKEMTAEKVNTMLYRKLLASTNQTGHFASWTEYKIDPESLVLLGTDISIKEKEIQPRSLGLGCQAHMPDYGKRKGPWCLVEDEKDRIQCERHNSAEIHIG
uniref:Uncharacterized protein n=1 Tax=Sphaerodactylus townsendi TaxID=933632 RepID=A0ACB8FNA5_9SAUR